MNSSKSKRVPIWKLFSKLRQIIAVVPEANAPWRSWDSASTREIQLEFDFEARRRKCVRDKVSATALRGQIVEGMGEPWCKNSNY
jgi:hypothetical protein